MIGGGCSICHLVCGICPCKLVVTVGLMSGPQNLLLCAIDGYHTGRPSGFCETHVEIHWHRSIGGLVTMLAMEEQHIGYRSVGKLLCLIGMRVWLRQRLHDNSIAGGVDE